MQFDPEDVTVEEIEQAECEGSFIESEDSCTLIATHAVLVELPGMGISIGVGRYCATCAGVVKTRLTTA